MTTFQTTWCPPWDQALSQRWVKLTSQIGHVTSPKWWVLWWPGNFELSLVKRIYIRIHILYYIVRSLYSYIYTVYLHVTKILHIYTHNTCDRFKKLLSNVKIGLCIDHLQQSNQWQKLRLPLFRSALGSHQACNVAQRHRPGLTGFGNLALTSGRNISVAMSRTFHP